MAQPLYFTLPDLMTAEECRRQIEQAERAGFEDAPISSKRGGPVRMESVRNNLRVMRDDPELAGRLWRRLAAHAPVLGGWDPVGLNERLRLYRYDVGHYFKPHADGRLVRDNGEASHFTLLVYLNHNYSGGETAFRDAVIRPSTGLCLVFAHPLVHESKTLRRGRKYVLRSDLMYRPTAHPSD
jgi:hypothetical protein